jgi:Family of unknown function (DUF6152)
MNRIRNAAASLLGGVILLAAPAMAHHGSNISYDLSKSWEQKATITKFGYINPHPIVLFDVKNAKGEIEHWHSEIVTNPSRMIRSGWGKIRSEEALKPGTVVTLTLSPAKAGGFSALITKIVNDKGEEIITGN